MLVAGARSSIGKWLLVTGQLERQEGRKLSVRKMTAQAGIAFEVLSQGFKSL